ncbi:hypothetical protein [Pseudomonas sp. 13B_3.2_Bac1]|uniref:hypothetical protein n=1 Tax=Pseudomonas sp. 13B_3.2_Bac1 TaxID=2971623 RepID=UPI0021C6FB59|nr:hypothetical protein [Pseudomonas sp. 13B_3.2_Bac1]MCU1775204.1 hypothetical protein [Pseudomonas sp. 13B_3.2_Bac1]
MGRRKIFNKTDLSVPKVEHRHDPVGNVVILPEPLPPTHTTVKFGRNASNSRSFDFARWYGCDIDPITYACQRQIERFLAGQDGGVSTCTVAAYCTCGLRHFLECCAMRATAFNHDLTLRNVDRDLIDSYLGHLTGLGVSTTTQKSIYTATKPVLLALGRRGLIPLITSGDASTFPRNPFPNSNRKAKGETALTNREQQAFSIALRQAIKPIWTDDALLTSELLAYALLVVALHTGRNTTPLLEMTRDCLHPHPKDNTVFLTLWKRRGYNSSKVALRAVSDAEHLLGSTPTVKYNVERLIRRVMVITEPFDSEAPGEIKGRVWLHRIRGGKDVGQVAVLNQHSLLLAMRRLVAEHALTDTDGKPLRINISRLRKTFANRIFELTDGDLATTAAALGNTSQVTDQYYLAPSEITRSNWQFMGEVLVQELLTRTIGATYRNTPVGRCADPVNGQYAPKREGATCMNFMNCLRCRHYAVTAEDLHKLFSFYFHVLAERSRMDKRRWAREYAHIPRLIEQYIVAEGLRRGIFKVEAVEAARERARALPHPFWSIDLVDSLEN